MRNPDQSNAGGRIVISFKKQSDKASEEKQLIERLRHVQRNTSRTCADCGDPGPIYIVMPFKVFVCVTCAGLHREYRHLVKGIGMSTWTRSEVDAVVAAGGNDVVNRQLLNVHGVAEPHKHPAPGDLGKLRNWIRLKYKDSFPPNELVPASSSQHTTIPPVPPASQIVEAASNARKAPTVDLLDLSLGTDEDVPAKSSLASTNHDSSTPEFAKDFLFDISSTFPVVADRSVGSRERRTAPAPTLLINTEFKDGKSGQQAESAAGQPTSSPSTLLSFGEMARTSSQIQEPLQASAGGATAVDWLSFDFSNHGSSAFTPADKLDGSSLGVSNFPGPKDSKQINEQNQVDEKLNFDLFPTNDNICLHKKVDSPRLEFGMARPTAANTSQERAVSLGSLEEVIEVNPPSIKDQDLAETKVNSTTSLNTLQNIPELSTTGIAENNIDPVVVRYGAPLEKVDLFDFGLSDNSKQCPDPCDLAGNIFAQELPATSMGGKPDMSKLTLQTASSETTKRSRAPSWAADFGVNQNWAGNAFDDETTPNLPQFTPDADAGEFSSHNPFQVNGLF